MIGRLIRSVTTTGVVLSIGVGCADADVERNGSTGIAVTAEDQMGDPGTGVESGVGPETPPADAIEAYERYSEHGFPGAAVLGEGEVVTVVLERRPLW